MAKNNFELVWELTKLSLALGYSGMACFLKDWLRQRLLESPAIWHCVRAHHVKFLGVWPGAGIGSVVK